MKPIRLAPEQWKKIKALLTEEYSCTPSVMLLRNKMKDVLGFTVRTHQEWFEDKIDRDEDTLLSTSDFKNRRGRYKNWIMLDFYSEPMRTMFLLKYSHMINES